MSYYDFRHRMNTSNDAPPVGIMADGPFCRYLVPRENGDFLVQCGAPAVVLHRCEEHLEHADPCNG